MPIIIIQGRRNTKKKLSNVKNALKSGTKKFAAWSKAKIRSMGSDKIYNKNTGHLEDTYDKMIVYKIKTNLINCFL